MCRADEAFEGRRRVAAVVLVLGMLMLFAACSGDHHEAAVSSVATARVTVTLDDRGLHATPASTKAGIIAFSLADRRAKPTGSEVLLYYEVQPNLGGDLITGVGGNVRVLLCAHTWYLVVRIDGAVKARTAFTTLGTSPDCRTTTVT